MKYRNETAFRQALQQRLKDRADGDGALLVRNRKRVAFDRLLARLLAVAQGQWVLKGGFALDLRLATRARSTKDVDIEWRAEETELLDVLLDAANYDAGDFFEFAIERAGVPEDRLGGSHRFRVSASLAGRSFESFLLDVGFRSDDALEAETLRTDDFLGFAEIEPVEVQAVPLELQVAEKLHAYTRVYEGGRTSSRTKDLIDLALIAELSQLDAAGLQREIDTIFELRGTHATPTSLPPPPAEWAGPFRQLAEEVGVPADLEVGHRDAAALVDPILSGEVPSGTWDSTRRRWVAERSSEGRRT
ncbi:MAG TPA: nucleotidyl transferase AbiEii/AbiGii toxin family protein [Solirubrobacterales bacterium]|nr:nucleotidyl transferase AbiEii/AbiGii toxin family protein [Solirubrobacterales bacterium]